MTSKVTTKVCGSFEVFANNTKLTFLYKKIDMEGF